MSEKLNLKWSDFQENLSSSFGSLREDDAFTDVTLACEDGKQMEAHKVILAASSPFFQNLLRKNKHAHPMMVYMRGVKSDNLVAMLDFLYFGEANVFQDNLDSFLATAEEFQLKGLATNTFEDDAKEEIQRHVKPPMKKQPKLMQRGSNELAYKEQENGAFQRTDNVVAAPNHLSGYLIELDEKVNSMIEKGGNFHPNRPQRNGHTCKVCGKEGHRNDIKKHIESNHLEGVCIPCNLCEKTFRSRKTFQEHNLKYHK